MTTEKLTLARGIPLSRQIADHVRGQIRSGALSADQMLPPAAILAEEWGVDATTVHRALARLAKEGLLDRKPRVGTFVRNERPTLTTIGVYLGGAVLRGESPFRLELSDAIRRESEKVGLDVQYFIDPRNDEESAEPLPQLLHAIEHHQIQALILTGTCPRLTAWFTKLKVPMAALAWRPQYTLDIDQDQFMGLALNALAEKGCRSVGLICSGPGHRRSMTEMLVDQAGDLNLEIRDGWVIGCSSLYPGPSYPSHLSMGQAAMQKLLECQKLPEGMIIYPDSIAAGSILALIEAGVSVPDDMQLVLHRNRGLPLLCPFPATYIESDPAEVAKLLVQQARHLHAGKVVETATIHHYLAT